MNKRLKLDKQPTGKITKHFYYSEFARSNYGKPEWNKLSMYLAFRLCHDILEPLRAAFGYGLNITSGIRDTIGDGGTAVGMILAQQRLAGRLVRDRVDTAAAPRAEPKHGLANKLRVTDDTINGSILSL